MLFYTGKKVKNFTLCKDLKCVQLYSAPGRFFGAGRYTAGVALTQMWDSLGQALNCSINPTNLSIQVTCRFLVAQYVCHRIQLTPVNEVN